MGKPVEQVVAEAMSGGNNGYSTHDIRVGAVVAALREAGLLAETEWEYGVDSSVFLDVRRYENQQVALAEAERFTNLWPSHLKAVVVRRRAAGEWEPMEGNNDD